MAAQLRTTLDKDETRQKLLKKVEPDDLVRFGLIPELIGRLPVVTVLDPLDEDALVRVLTEPKNSIVRQYKELLHLDNAELVFTDAALHAIAKKTVERKSGAPWFAQRGGGSADPHHVRYPVGCIHHQGDHRCRYRGKAGNRMWNTV